MLQRTADVERRLDAHGRLVGDAVHRLRSPLNAIVSWLHVLDGPQAGEDELVAARGALSRSCRSIARELDRLLLGADWLASGTADGAVDLGRIVEVTVASLAREQVPRLVCQPSPAGSLIAGDERGLRWLVRELVDGGRGDPDRGLGLVVAGRSTCVELWLVSVDGSSDRLDVPPPDALAAAIDGVDPDGGHSVGSRGDLLSILVEVQGGRLLRPAQPAPWLLGIRWPRWEEP